MNMSVSVTETKKKLELLTRWTGESGVSPVRTLHDSRPKDRGPAWEICQRLRVTSNSHCRGAWAEVQAGRRWRAQAAEAGQSGQNSSRRCCSHGGRSPSGDDCGAAQDVVYSVRCGSRILMRRSDGGKSRRCFNSRRRYRNTARVWRGSCRRCGRSRPTRRQRVSWIERRLHFGHTMQSS